MIPLAWFSLAHKHKHKDVHTRRMAYLTELSIPALLNPMINKLADTILLLMCSHEVWVKVTHDWSTALCLCLCLCRPSFHSSKLQHKHTHKQQKKKLVCFSCAYAYAYVHPVFTCLHMCLCLCLFASENQTFKGLASIMTGKYCSVPFSWLVTSQKLLDKMFETHFYYNIKQRTTYTLHRLTMYLIKKPQFININ